jgi:solute:Na+ symporter, SSS family
VNLSLIDLFVLAVYFALVGGIGLYVSRGQRTAAQYFIAGRSIPAWAVAFTLMATFIGTGTFVGHPGTSYQKGLILLVPHMVLPLVLWIVARYIVPFYRRVVQMSAYEFIGRRFGLAGRVYTSFGFLADRTFDLGVTLLTTAFAVNVLTGWSLPATILGVGLFTMAYTMLGGMRAVVWTDVAQGMILIGGGVFILLRLLFAPEAGAPFSVVTQAWQDNRMSLGSFELTWRSLFDLEVTTLWLFLITYLVQWCRRYLTDQHLVQRYLIARTDAEASRGAMWNAWICIPTFALFMFIGSCLHGFFVLAPVPGPAMGDSVMPYFMAHFMPAGLLGLVVAAVLAAAMSTVSSDLNSVSTVITTDYFTNFLPRSSERARLICGRLMVLVGGVCAALVALLLIPQQESTPLMERVITITAILSGGTLGLFCLGFLTRTATRRGAYIGIACCLVFMAWAILTQPRTRLVDVGFNFPFNPILIGISSHLVLFGCGYLASRLFGGYRPDDAEEFTLWRRPTSGRAGTSEVAAGSH